MRKKTTNNFSLSTEKRKNLKSKNPSRKNTKIGFNLEKSLSESDSSVSQDLRSKINLKSKSPPNYFIAKITVEDFK